MRRINLISITIILILVAQSVSANGIYGSSGYAPEKIDEGSEVMFYGTIYNVASYDVYVQTMNITFIENLGEGATATPRNYTINTSYNEDPISLPSNTSYTDTISATIDYRPGQYNVSIFFQYSNTTASPVGTWATAYSLINQTVLVAGVTNPQKIFNAFIISLGALTLVFVGLVIRSKYFKK